MPARVNRPRCTAYTYTLGSDYPESVLDSGPHSYWRLDETSGTTAAVVGLANEGTDNAHLLRRDVGTRTRGRWPGSTATAATFNGTSSYVTLPQNLVSGESYQSVSLWFKTTTANGVLFSYQSSPLSAGTTTTQLHAGAVHRQRREAVRRVLARRHAPRWRPRPRSTDGKWHLVTLTAAGNTQTLYLDGSSRSVRWPGRSASPRRPTTTSAPGSSAATGPTSRTTKRAATPATPTYFTGDISDAAFWTRPLTAAEVTTLYGAGTHQAAC